jgi:hypothetical protein
MEEAGRGKRGGEGEGAWWRTEERKAGGEGGDGEEEERGRADELRTEHERRRLLVRWRGMEERHCCTEQRVQAEGIITSNQEGRSSGGSGSKVRRAAFSPSEWAKGS